MAQRDSSGPRVELTWVTGGERAGEERVPPGRAVVFFHLPKAAGTTLDRLLAAIAESRNEIWHRVPGTLYGQFLGPGKPDAGVELERTVAERLHRADYLSGHLPWGAQRRLSRPTFCVTLLRHPLERCLSHFRFGVERGGWSETDELERVFAAGRLLDNPQVRQLAGALSASETCDRSMLERARSHLRTGFDLVGVAERFDAFLAAMIRTLGWPDLLYESSQVSTVPIAAARRRRLLEAAVEYNRYDLELYRLVERETAGRDAPRSDVGSPASDRNGLLLVSPGVRWRGADHHLFRDPAEARAAIDLLRRVAVIRRAGEGAESDASRAG